MGYSFFPRFRAGIGNCPRHVLKHVVIEMPHSFNSIMLKRVFNPGDGGLAESSAVTGGGE